MKTLLSYKGGGKFDKSKLNKYDREFFESKLDYNYKGKSSPTEVHDRVKKEYSPDSKIRSASYKKKNRNTSAREIIEKVMHKVPGMIH
jgi:hypothetical protein